MGFTLIEDALRLRILIQMSDYLDETRCVKSDVDGLYNAMQQAQSNYGCLLDYGGGQRLEEAPYSGKMWQWLISGAFLVRYTGDNRAVEEAARFFIDQIFSILDGDHTLGGICGVARLTEILPPQPGSINDTPFYWLIFTVEVIEKI